MSTAKAKKARAPAAIDTGPFVKQPIAGQPSYMSPTKASTQRTGLGEIADPVEQQRIQSELSELEQRNSLLQEEMKKLKEAEQQISRQVVPNSQSKKPRNTVAGSSSGKFKGLKDTGVQRNSFAHKISGASAY